MVNKGLGSPAHFLCSQELQYPSQNIASCPGLLLVDSIIVSRQIGQIHPPFFLGFFLFTFCGESPEGLERFKLALVSILEISFSAEDMVSRWSRHGR